MSNEPTNNGVIDNAQANEPSADVREDSFVPKPAFEEVTRDMHKFKSKYKNVAAELEALKAEREAAERARLEEQQQFQKLYEEEKKRRAQLEQSLSEKDKQYQTFTKKQALKSALGDVKDEYLSFANVDAIEFLDDGRLDPESVHRVANEFRQSHPQLISKPVAGDITSKAAPIENGLKPGQVDISKLSTKEKIEMLKQLKNK